MVLAFLTTQHHNLHMILLAVRLGGSGMTFVRAYPGIHRGMLLGSFAIVAVTLQSLRRPLPPAMRAAVVGLSALTVGIIGWSLIRFGF